MAVAILSQPGDDYGPCAQKCRHKECRKMLQTAAEPCGRCGQPIGFGNEYYFCDRGPLVHVDCAAAAAKQLRERLARKLHPARFTGMSARMAAIVGCVLGEVWTQPHFAGVSITSDGYVLAFDATRGRHAFIGDGSDLDRNVATLLRVAGLDAEERREWARRYAAVVDDWRPGGNAWHRHA